MGLKFRLSIKDLPNQLTLIRIAVVPILLILFPFGIDGLRLFCALLFAIAGMTDWLDGVVARQFKLESKLGALIDPIADKMLTGTGLILLAHSHDLWAWMAGTLLCRELVLSGLRQVAQQQGIVIQVNSLGKWKTLFLDVAIVCLMVNRPLFGWPFTQVGMVCIWAALFFSLYSAWLYIQEFWQKSQIS